MHVRRMVSQVYFGKGNENRNENGFHPMFTTNEKIRNVAEKLRERHLSIMLTAFNASFAWQEHKILGKERGDDGHDAAHVLQVSAHV